jgi:8-oxo-dGTP pyrophosphatase MutT (NUDIX family)
LVGPSARWQLPKGMVDPGETTEVTAKREVREEGGVDSEMVAPLEVIEYWYYITHNNLRTRIHKFVHFYLLEYRSGDPADHDHEVNEARWVEINKALEMVRFESEKRVLRLAKEMLLT